jgi:hypothetical protein
VIDQLRAFVLFNECQTGLGRGPPHPTAKPWPGESEQHRRNRHQPKCHQGIALEPGDNGHGTTGETAYEAHQRRGGTDAGGVSLQPVAREALHAPHAIMMLAD